MRYDTAHNPDFGMLRVTFDQPGEVIVAESGAMVSRDQAIDMKTNMRGGIGGALKRKLLGGESLFQNTFTSTAAGQSLMLAPAAEGCIQCMEIGPGKEIFLQSGAYLASTPGVTLDTKWQGAKGFFIGDFFVLRAHGQGLIWFSSYGAIHTIDVGTLPDGSVRYQGYICDNSNLLGFTEGLSYRIRKVGGMKSLLFSGEGVVCEFSGQGQLWLQTRNPSALAAFLHPYRRVESNND